MISYLLGIKIFCMEPKFQTSFIPKKPLDSSPKDFLYKPSSGSLFYNISILIFIIAILLCGGLFFYKKLLVKQIDSANQQITLAREALEEDTIKELLRYDARLKSAKRILENHTLTYVLFDQLEEITLKSIRFSNFKYKNLDGQISIESEVFSKTYNALAQQSSMFSSNNFMLNPVFSNFKLTEEGYISGEFRSSVENSLVSYKKISNSSKNQ